MHDIDCDRRLFFRESHIKNSARYRMGRDPIYKLKLRVIAATLSKDYYTHINQFWECTQTQARLDNDREPFIRRPSSSRGSSCYLSDSE